MATVVADLDALVADGVLTPDQARVLQDRSRAAMLGLVVHVLLAGGVLAAAGGFVLVLADALAVALAGALFVAGGIAVLARADAIWRMFGQSAALIGAGMLIGGGVLHALDVLGERGAGLAFLLAGAALAAVAGGAFRRASPALRFVTGFLMLAGIGLHIAGAYMLAAHADLDGLPVALLHLYAAALIAAAGWLTDVRLVTALAIAPFAQMLDTSTFYFHAAYVFYSPEPTLSVIQMGLLVAACLRVIRHRPDRDGRHAGILAILAFVVANLCLLVASLWGDTVGDTFVRARLEASGDSWEIVQQRFDAWQATALRIPEGVFSILWAAALAACAVWAGRSHRRGLFNASLTFGAIHAYTQMFESFGDEPLAWLLGGMAAIPLAWGLWRLNRRLG
jgi:hypothetical protein